jgi:glycosyltransferase 2 family protein
VWMYRQRQGSVAVVLVLTWVGQVGFVTAFYCCANALWSPALGPVPSLIQHFLLVPIGLVMQALVPTPGGAGGGEWGFAALYVLFRAAEANGVLASLLVRVFSWVLGLAGYVVYLWMKPVLAGADAAELAPAQAPAAPLAVPAG